VSAVAVGSSPVVGPGAARRGAGWWFKRIVGALLVLVLGLAGSGLAYQAIATQSDWRSMPPTGQLVAVNGTSLHIQCTGQGGPTVILETGLGAWSSHWALIQPAVAEHTRVCSYDRAGLGWSDAGPSPRDARQIATELHALLQTAAVPGPYVLAGHSNGGLYARMFASLYPDEVVGLVLADATPVDLFERLPATRGDFASVEQQSRTFGWLAPFGVVRLLIPSAVGPELARLPARARDDIIARNSTGPQWTGLAAELDALSASMVQVAQTGDLGARPLVVLSSTRGAAASVADAQTKLQLDAEIAALSSNSRHVVVEGATHTGLASNPNHAAYLADAIRQVLGSVRTGQPLGSE
jgi:pimeloyl-ACP methyl ester carboxylesterase